MNSSSHCGYLCYISAAYKHADGKKIDGRRVLVDVERARTVKGWRPRRLGKASFTLAPAYNEFGYNEHPDIASRFLCNNIIDCHAKTFGYNEHPLVISSFFCIILLVVSGTQCIFK